MELAQKLKGNKKGKAAETVQSQNAAAATSDKVSESKSDT